MAPTEPAPDRRRQQPCSRLKDSGCGRFDIAFIAAEPELVAPEAAPLVQEPAVARGGRAAKLDAARRSRGHRAGCGGWQLKPGPVESKPSEEPAFIEVWRPAGRSERRPHRPRRPQRPQQTQVPVSGVRHVRCAAPPAEGAAASPASEAARRRAARVRVTRRRSPRSRETAGPA